MQYKVAIIGPGAMGCLFAARFKQAGIQTVLVDYRSDRAERLNQKGIRLVNNDKITVYQVPCVLEVPKESDIIILFVKSYQTKKIKRLPSAAVVLTLQNGLGNAEKLCALVGSENVVAGVTYEAAYLESEGTVIHTASGVTRFGPWTTCSTSPIEKILSKAGFDFEVTEAPGQAIWEKVIINAGINPITAILNIPNGSILRIPEARQLLRDLVVEAVKVATAEGYKFPYSLIEKAEDVCEKTAKNYSSMLQDIRANRKTEIDEISGEILERAQQAGVPTPRTRVIWQLVKALEQK